MKRFVRFFSILAVLSIVLLSQSIGSVYGQSNALAISPRKDYNLKPGEAVDDVLTVTNRNTTDSLNLKLSIIDFEAQDESGIPKLMRQSTDRTAWSLKNYVDLPQQVSVAPGETVRIPIRVAMPNDVGAGSYYSAIEYSAMGDTVEEQVNISASGVSLVFVNVPGQTTRQLSLLQFGAFVPSQDNTTGAFKGIYFGDKPNVMSYRLKNDGNVAEQPKGVMKIKNSSGDVIYTIDDVNAKNQLAIRGQTRRFDTCIKPEEITETTPTGADVNTVVCGDTDFAPGRYVAELSVIYGGNGNETSDITARATFWYLPWWFIGLIVVVIGLVTGAGLYLWNRFQSYRGRKTRRR